MEVWICVDNDGDDDDDDDDGNNNNNGDNNNICNNNVGFKFRKARRAIYCYCSSCFVPKFQGVINPRYENQSRQKGNHQLSKEDMQNFGDSSDSRCICFKKSNKEDALFTDRTLRKWEFGSWRFQATGSDYFMTVSYRRSAKFLATPLQKKNSKFVRLNYFLTNAPTKRWYVTLTKYNSTYAFRVCQICF